jgi:hypothetical protein
MADINPQLETALAASISSASHPHGLTPAQVSQLRSAITNDQRVLVRLNENAEKGYLRNFEMTAHGSHNMLGAYSKDTGSITLPADSFNHGSNLNATLRVQNMSMQFAHVTITDETTHVQQQVTQEMIGNLQNTLNHSPVLAEQVRHAVAGTNPPLAHFAPLTGTVAGGSYNGNSRTMNLPLTDLSTRFNERDMTFVLGHEIQHSLNRTHMQEPHRTFDQQIASIAQNPAEPHDYTAPIQKMLAANRWDEATAQIAGWNALLSHERQLNPHAGLATMLTKGNSPDGTTRVFDFIKNDPTSRHPQPLPGFHFNHDATLTPTPANTKAEGHYYFDKKPEQTGIGFHGDSDYPNYYAAGLVSSVAYTECAHVKPGANGEQPPISIDLNRLHLHENLMERNGISITNCAHSREPYINSGEQLPQPPRHFDNTYHSHEYVPAQPGLASGMAPSLGATNQTTSSREQDTPAAQHTETNRPPAATQDMPSSTQDLNAFLDRMIAASQAGDQATFRQMTQTLANSPSGQELHAQSVAAVDRFEAQQAQQQLQQQMAQEGPVMRMHR